MIQYQSIGCVVLLAAGLFLAAGVTTQVKLKESFMNRIVIILASLMITMSLPGPAAAWSHANRWGGDTMHECGSAWLRPVYGAGGVYYQVVPAP